MEYNVGKDNSYAVGARNDSYGVSGNDVAYSGDSLKSSVDYSDRNINVEIGSSSRCPGGCSVCKGACRN